MQVHVAVRDPIGLIGSQMSSQSRNGRPEGVLECWHSLKAFVQPSALGALLCFSVERLTISEF